MKNKFTRPFFLGIFFVLLGSCSTDDVALSSDWPEFSAQKEFNDQINVAANLSISELIKFEQSKGYRSFGRIADELYEKALEAETKEALYAFVEENSTYLKIIEEENGERSLEVAYSDNPARYLMNKDRIYQVGDRLIKVFSTGKLAAGLDEVNYLKGMSDMEFLAIERVESDSTINARILDDAYYCSDADVTVGDGGDNRIRCVLIAGSEKDVVGLWYPYWHYEVKNQRKQLGIWVNTDKTFESEADVYVDYSEHNVSDGWNRDFGTVHVYKKAKKWAYRKYLDGSLYDDVPVYGTNDFHVHFGDYRFWARNTSVGTFNRSCSTTLL